MIKPAIFALLALGLIGCELFNQRWEPCVNPSCANCRGTGTFRCATCLGRGNDRCNHCSFGRGRCLCNGSGRNPYDARLRCTSCGGIGTTVCSWCNGSGTRACSRCNGDGLQNCDRYIRIDAR